MDVKRFKKYIHKLELSENYNEIYDLMYIEEQREHIDSKMYCFLISEVVFILEEIESPFCQTESLKGKYDLYYCLLARLIDYQYKKVENDKCVDWYLCYYIYYYPKKI